MKQVTKIVIALIAMGCLVACAAKGENTTTASDPAKENNETVEKTDIIVFAAASMTETLEEIKSKYESENPDINIIYNFDSSGTLKTQIEEGAECDIFISAGQKQMNQLDINDTTGENIDGLDFVDEASRVDLLENEVTLVVPKENPKDINSFSDMAKGLNDGDIMMAMGNEDVPVGQYTKKILDYFEIDEKNLNDKGIVTYGSNVKEVTTQVAEASVDCGIVYCTDAFSAGITVVDAATSQMCGQVIYPACVLKTSENKELAIKLLDFIKSDAAMEIFEGVGFKRIK